GRHLALVADLVLQMLAERRAALEAERGIERVRAIVDPAAERLAACFRKGLPHQLSVVYYADCPTGIAKHGLELFPKTFANHGIEALAIVVDHPPGVAQAVLPAFGERFEDVALVHLGVTDKRDHPPLAAVLRPAVRLDVILRQRREQRLRDAEPDRAGREIDIVGVLGPRRIGLRALEAAEVLQLVAALAAEQILDGVKHRARMRLHRDPIL